MTHGPLSGFTIGVTAARKVEEQVALLERRGAATVWAPALALDPRRVDDATLRAVTEEVLARPVDLFLATTGIGMKAWFDAAESWGLLDDLVAHLGRAEILARGPKSVGALRRRGLRELWSPESERFDDVLAHLRGRDLTDAHIVVQEHGQSLSMVAHALRRLGAVVTSVAVYRVEAAEDPTPMFGLIDHIADRSVDAVTFTSAPAVAALMEAAASVGRRDEVVAAFQADVLAASVGPVTTAAFELWGVPTVEPDRARLAAMVKMLETELPLRSEGLALEAGGHLLRLVGDTVLVDGVEAPLTPAPLAVLHALAENPGAVVPRRTLLAALPRGADGSDHAVDMAVARLRAAVGTKVVQTVVKRGYRLAVES
ncbi:uroporphyrinogen-III synthase [Nocardioides zeae]|uniref:Uroporphyrinogen-III synthase n=2 Tax=Nocardioides zeae TaxID=1457234 RepID=A0ACC6ILB8_9ACTN|nr:uroporphyrinogen-III synthase [Nocardioides zeae]MDQ1106317.1 uroporphyrinogen-III synthase [Nocardioides zeae]MDR6173997.1 uroporphyrinogen-III synthase [Nocardioides zeae]MDR6211448.1 uroporphyrinogen-III synthase [Nocardioides zeae]